MLAEKNGPTSGVPEIGVEPFGHCILLSHRNPAQVCGSMTERYRKLRDLLAS
ncbi:MAG: hypothetical protein JO287_17930 [Pseudonocardiales bacterium]|nr:hypothetical protein [Pseudonocardiales bacterium]